jgi:3-deoxy-D-manno-octulosonate 8-phosphate phosphatase KdsC-like HAD superfamily phosphatase
MNIKDARIYWNNETKEFGVEEGIGLMSSNNVRFPCWLTTARGGKTSEKRVLSLLTEVIWLVEKKDFDLKEILKELRKISEIEKALNEDPFLYI